jgi:hypothetical protein
MILLLALGCSLFAPSGPAEVRRTLTVDAAGRVTLEVVDLGADDHNDQRTEYRYDDAGRLHQALVGLDPETATVHTWTYTGDQPTRMDATDGGALTLRAEMRWDGARMTHRTVHDAKGKQVSRQRYHWVEGRLDRWVSLDAAGHAFHVRRFHWADHALDWVDTSEGREVARGRCEYAPDGTLTRYAYDMDADGDLDQDLAFDHVSPTRLVRDETTPLSKTRVEQTTTRDATGSPTQIEVTAGDRVTYRQYLRYNRPDGGAATVRPWNDQRAVPLPGREPHGSALLPDCPEWGQRSTPPTSAASDGLGVP